MQPREIKNGKILYSYLAVLPTYCVVFERADHQKTRSKSQIEQNAKSFAKEKNTGLLSKNSQKKIKNTVNWLLQLSDFKQIDIDGKTVKSRISFITLTLPSKQIHSDQVIKDQCLNHFLIELRNENQDFLYIWKAEKQKNGNIHFHVTSNIVYDYKRLQDKWNRIVNKLGYVDRFAALQRQKYKDGFYYDVRIHQKFRIDKDKQKKRYYKALSEGFKNPHSTEIKNVKNVSNIAAYISKYIAKNDLSNENKVTGKIWSCSSQLSKMKITIDLQHFDIDLNQFKHVSKNMVTVYFADVLELCSIGLQDEILKQVQTILNN